MNGDLAFREFATAVENAKKANKLHSQVKGRLSELLKRLYPDACPVSEIAGVLGGRNDLIQFFPNGRRVVFEIFASPSQVPQDLRLLELSTAEVKVAILLDREIDSKLANEYFHKKPDTFPFIWLSHVMLPEHEVVCRAELRKVIERSQTPSDGLNTMPSHHPVNFDVYEKRLAQSHALEELLAIIIRDGNVNLQDLFTFLKKTRDSDFLFGEEISNYLSEIHKKGINLRSIEQRLHDSGLPVGEERTRLAEQDGELLKWFVDQFQVSRRKFSKWLSLESLK